MKRVVKIVILLLCVVSVVFCSIGCSIVSSKTQETFEVANEYAMRISNLVNLFSIHSQSNMTKSSRTEDSVFVSYDNGDVLNVSVVFVKPLALEMNLNYTFNTFLSVEELCQIISEISDGEVTEHEKELLEVFVENQSITEFRGFRLEVNKQTFHLKFVAD